MKPTQQEKRRNTPRKKKHRAALELTSTPSKTDKLIQRLLKQKERVREQQEKFEELITTQVVDGMIKEANDKLDKPITSLPLYSLDGHKKIVVSQKTVTIFDGRAEQGAALINQVIDDYSESQEHPDHELLTTFLKGIFQGARSVIRKTPQLMKFLTLPEKKIHDKRLLEAQKLIRESMKSVPSKWYTEVYELDPETGEWRPF